LIFAINLPLKPNNYSKCEATQFESVFTPVERTGRNNAKLRNRVQEEYHCCFIKICIPVTEES
jgi:hypothetical protein